MSIQPVTAGTAPCQQLHSRARSSWRWRDDGLRRHQRQSPGRPRCHRRCCHRFAIPEWDRDKPYRAGVFFQNRGPGVMLLQDTAARPRVARVMQNELQVRNIEHLALARTVCLSCLRRIESTTVTTTDCTGSCSSNRRGVAERPTAAPYSIQGVMRRSCQAATDTGGDHTQY